MEELQVSTGKEGDGREAIVRCERMEVVNSMFVSTQQNIVTLHGIMGDIVQMAMIQGETVGRSYVLFPDYLYVLWD